MHEPNVVAAVDAGIRRSAAVHMQRVEIHEHADQLRQYGRTKSQWSRSMIIR
ncbi:hypothetical protein XHC_4037 [Xanthomonas hortorum pv. carotae str. M081]|nr:hypothetical protein XHC_4037 [Xanthomonas hortorum pv. carotae str. M081]